MMLWFKNMCVFDSSNWGPLTLYFKKYPWDPPSVTRESLPLEIGRRHEFGGLLSQPVAQRPAPEENGRSRKITWHGEWCCPRDFLLPLVKVCVFVPPPKVHVSYESEFGSAPTTLLCMALRDRRDRRTRTGERPPRTGMMVKS